MKAEKKNVDKNALIHAVRAKGFTARKAAKGVNAVIDLWKYALWCGEEVEVPGGILQAKITKGTEWATLQMFQNIHTKEPMVRTVHTPGRRRVVKLKPDPGLGLIPDPPPPPPPPPLPPSAPMPLPPPPETAEELEERQLAGALLGRPADPATMAALRHAVGADPRNRWVRVASRPGALLRRLQFIKSRGWQFRSVDELAQRVSQQYWL
jgi:hypothetical protein